MCTMDFQILWPLFVLSPLHLYWSTQIVVCCLQHFVGLNHFSNDTWRSYIARPIVRWRTKPPTLNEKSPRTLLGSRAVPSVFRFDKHPGRNLNWQAFCGRVLEWSPLSLFQVELECVCVPMQLRVATHVYHVCNLVNMWVSEWLQTGLPSSSH